MKLLITGGAGFIGSNFIHYLLKTYGNTVEIHNVDVLTYAGNINNLKTLKSPSYFFYKVDITDREALRTVFETVKPEAVVHFAAESHVDRSILDSRPFVLTNVMGTLNLLDLAKEGAVKRFVHVSTDEVYGELGETGLFTEETPLQPNSPYSASKAGSDLLVRSYVETFGFPGLITRCSNNYGPYQFPEKLIPLMITNAMQDKPLPVYGKGQNVRDWIYVEDHCRAIDVVLQKGKIGQVYNAGGNAQRKNIDVVKQILKILGKPESLITFVTDRLGHDFRYAIDSSKLERELGWTPQVDFETGLKRTIEWYQQNGEWLEELKSK
jgi:dTDP-glucose 4,6-dehydratase